MPKKNNNKVVYILITIIVIEALLLIVSSQKRPRPLPKPLPEPKAEEKKIERPKTYEGRIAIVLDDWGYSLAGFKILEKIKEPLTIAILPNLKYSSESAEKARELGDEIILHLPLEPYKQQYSRMEQNTILVNMPERTILKILGEDIKSVPGISGVSNHMGSKATEDRALMKIIFSRLKAKKLYFLDSFTSKTICKEAAASTGVPYTSRHVFLDNISDPEYIIRQSETLARIAKQQGAAIGIGHSRINTLETLLRVIPQLKKRGFKFIFVSELVR